MENLQLYKKLTKLEVLHEANNWIEQAAIKENMEKVKIIAGDIPLDALSEVGSEPEDMHPDDIKDYAKRAGLGEVQVKWMSHRKGWTSDAVSKMISHY